MTVQYLSGYDADDAEGSRADQDHRNRFRSRTDLTGNVVSIKEFGAFLEFAPGKEGMVHISKIAKERINHVEDVLTLEIK